MSHINAPKQIAFKIPKVSDINEKMEDIPEVILRVGTQRPVSKQ